MLEIESSLFESSDCIFAGFLFYKRRVKSAGENINTGVVENLEVFSEILLDDIATLSCIKLVKLFIIPEQHLLCPATKKVAGYYVIPSEILSVRPSVRQHPHHSCAHNSSYSFRPILFKLYRRF